MVTHTTKGGGGMKKREMLKAGYLPFLLVGLLASLPEDSSGRIQDQDQPGRPTFNALRIVSEKNVLNAEDTLGRPDGRYAEILPGGQLVVLMEKTFFDFGMLVCKGGDDYGLEGRVKMQDTHVEEQDYAWMIINRGPSNRFDFWGTDTSRPRGGYWGMTVNMIRITNFGTNSLFVDAVVGYSTGSERR
jgi:hypothetical protein